MAERFPALSHAEGPDIRVRPLRADDHAALFAAAADPLIWAQHPSQDRHTAVGFKRWFDQALGDGALLVENRSTGAALGRSRFYDWSPGTREVAIGHTFLVRACWQGFPHLISLEPYFRQRPVAPPWPVPSYTVLSPPPPRPYVP